jgi:hypothetical protein
MIVAHEAVFRDYMVSEKLAPVVREICSDTRIFRQNKAAFAKPSRKGRAA